MLTSTNAPSTVSSSSSIRGRTFSRRTRGIHPFLKLVRSVYRAQHRKPQYEAGCVYWIEQFLRSYPGVPIRRLRRDQAQAFLASKGTRPTVTAQEEKQAREALHFLWAEVFPHLRRP